jgi:hypothetical protein
MTYQSEKRRIDRQYAARQAAAKVDEFRANCAKSPKAWAWKLRERELAGEELVEHSRDAWRAALEHELLNLPKGNWS